MVCIARVSPGPSFHIVVRVLRVEVEARVAVATHTVKVTEFVVCDDTGALHLTLWDDRLTELAHSSVGHVVCLVHVWLEHLQGYPRLLMGPHTSSDILTLQEAVAGGWVRPEETGPSEATPTHNLSLWEHVLR